MNEILANSNLKTAISKIDTLRNRLVLSDVLKKTIHLYKKILEKNIIKGRPADAMIAATIYVTCRDSKTSHTLNDIIEVTGLRKKSIAKCYRAILGTLNLQIPVSDANQCALRIANSLKIYEKTKQHAIIILDQAKKRNHLAGKDQMGIAAAAICLASMDNGEKISQQKLAKAAMLTEVTIRNQCNGLRSLN